MGEDLKQKKDRESFKIRYGMGPLTNHFFRRQGAAAGWRDIYDRSKDLNIQDTLLLVSVQGRLGVVVLAAGDDFKAALEAV